MRILFVDDEPAIRETMPAILSAHGFTVDVAGNVPEALQFINRTQYDVLISDLNIGEPGDGFTVVSAMRRTQPDCRNIILTGYPGFETALQAIRNQVDDYLIKPTRIDQLIEAVEREPSPAHTAVKVKPLAVILREHRQEIVDRVVQFMKDHHVGAQTLTDEERTDHLPALIDEIVEGLESHGRLIDRPMTPAVEHGRLRYAQRYSLTELVDDNLALDVTIYDIIQENLLAVDLSSLLPALKTINETLDARLKESLNAFLDVARKAA